MWPVVLAILAKLVTLVGATAQTAGVLTFFTLESLVPYRWPLILGGTTIIALSEGVQYFVARRVLESTERNSNSSLP